jgi:indolepyruvate decarboxylase
MVDGSDCILMLGVMLTDLMIGSAKPAFASRQTVRANIGTRDRPGSLKVRNHTYEDIVFQEFCSALFGKYAEIAKKPSPAIFKKEAKKRWVANKETKITTVRFFEKVDSIIDKNSAIVTDVGDVLFGALDLTVDHVNSYISPAYYTSMGNAIPASLGVCLAKPGVRPIVLVGDGAFQMSLSEISNLVRYKLNPIIFVLNNRGYTTERFILDGKFNDIADWNYHKVTDVFGGEGYKVYTEQDLDAAVAKSLASDQVSVINVVVGPKDVSPALERVTASLSKRLI